MSAPAPIFVAGTGRSGTSQLANILGEEPLADRGGNGMATISVDPADQSLVHRSKRGCSVERTTGFEPATLTLARCWELRLSALSTADGA
jgi:hypothetical protein